MDLNPTVVHVTHEAIGKIGGIGAVLEGLLTSPSYKKTIGRNILISPMFSWDSDASMRLGEDSKVLFSSVDNISNTAYAHIFLKLEEFFNVRIIYGTKIFTDPLSGISSSSEVILIDIYQMNLEPLNVLKGKMYDAFGIKSDLYENLWEFEQYMRIAPVAIEILNMIVTDEAPTIILAHEFMGIPTALAAKLDETHDYKTVFYAHEVAPIRRIVEQNLGHDTMFYNVMREARKLNLSMHDIFGDQNHLFKSALVETARYCDEILAVGDYVVEELRFLTPEFSDASINLTYNGIPAWKIKLSEKMASRDKMIEYCENLLDFRPDHIFTHVTRMTPSKGLWRDLRVLEHLDKMFTEQNKKGVLFVLSTEAGKRGREDILQMEKDYNWPVAHHEGWPDLSGQESIFYARVQEFNAKARNIKVVYINQFGWDQDSCGERMQSSMEFMDIRKGSDVEFGQSIYEPFGIAQLEPLSFGGICVITNVCGCAGFVDAILNGDDTSNVIIAHYTDIGPNNRKIEDYKAINEQFRSTIEDKLSKDIAKQLYMRLPETEEDFEIFLGDGYEIAKNMGWDAVCQKYVLKSLDRAAQKKTYARQ